MAAAVNLAITLILAVLTGWYVYLTRRMLLMQQGQFESSISARGQEQLRARKRLALLISRFDKVLDQLPWDDNAFDAKALDRFAKVSLWNANDMDTIENAILAVGPESAPVAGDFVDSVRWLAAEHQKLLADPRSSSSFDQDEYRHRLVTAKTKLSEITKVLIDSVGGDERS